MAEVLITLGIIGVVAALTLPTLIANYRNQVYVTQLQKTVSILEQGFKKALADDEVDDLNDTEMFSYLNKVYDTNCANLSNFDDEKGQGVINYLKKYFNIVDYSSDGHFSAKDLAPGNVMNLNAPVGKLTFADGSQMLINYFRSCGGSNNSFFFIDVNAEKAPNVLGKDIYFFYLERDGSLSPYSSKKYGYWKNNSEKCGEFGKKISKTDNVVGDGCSARIIENGWKIDYL